MFDEKWDIRFLKMAEHVSTWSKDPSTQAGAVIVRSDRSIASVGYNGFPLGMSDSFDRLHNREDKYERTVHAEMNAILSSHEKLDGYVLYTWPFLTCHRCAVHVIQSGITSVVAPACPADKADRWEAKFAMSRDYYTESGISVHEYPLDRLQS